MRTKITKISGKQFALANAVTIGLFTLIFVPIFILVSVFGDSETKYLWIFAIALPVIYFALVYALTRFFVWVFNKVLLWMNGIEIETTNQIIEETRGN